MDAVGCWCVVLRYLADYMHRSLCIHGFLCIDVFLYAWIYVLGSVAFGMDLNA